MDNMTKEKKYFLASKFLTFFIFLQLLAPPLSSAITPQKEAGDDIIVHEWGTFTSVQSSEGKLLPGLHKGDERLPRFVHCLKGVGFSYGGCLDLFQTNKKKNLVVTQRMETPVIYFYTDKSQTVEVDVGFPGGVFSEWYPREETVSPNSRLKKVANGTIKWKVNLKNYRLKVPFVEPENIWAPSRVVQANYLSHVTKVENEKAENERFIFYRGIGDFQLPLVATNPEGQKLKIQNNRDEEIPFVVLMNISKNKGKIIPLGKIAGRGSLDVDLNRIKLDDKSDSLDLFTVKAHAKLVEGLIKSGLYFDEAKAMGDTWTRSYFHSEGLRILYILPRQWTDEILPIKLNPVPKKMVRTMVGRVEVFTKSDEENFLSSIETACNNKDILYNFVSSRRHRFVESMLWRALEMTKDKKMKKCIEEVISYEL